MIIFQVAKTAVGWISVGNHLLLLGGLIQLFGTLAALASAIIAYKTITIFDRSTSATEKSTITSEKAALARIFLDVADLWSKIYKVRNELLSSEKIVTAADLHTQYKTNFREFLKSQEWKSLRKICNFYEKLGVIIDKECIDPVPLFVLVTVDVFKEISYDKDVAEVVEVPEGIMYRRLKGPIEYLRDVYRPDIYKYYDHYLLPMYKRHIGVTDEELGKRVDSYFENHRLYCKPS